MEWSHHRISSTDSRVRVTLQNSIKHSGSERVKEKREIQNLRLPCVGRPSGSVLQALKGKTFKAISTSLKGFLYVLCFVAVITCAVLPQQAHGTKTCTGQGYEYNDQCTFTCDVGYERKGSSVRTCQADGQWSGTQATCEGI